MTSGTVLYTHPKYQRFLVPVLDGFKDPIRVSFFRKYVVLPTLAQFTTILRALASSGTNLIEPSWMTILEHQQVKNVSMPQQVGILYSSTVARFLRLVVVQVVSVRYFFVQLLVSFIVLTIRTPSMPTCCALSMQRLKLVQASFISFADNTFDKAFCLGVLQHTPSFTDSVASLISKTALEVRSLLIFILSMVGTPGFIRSIFYVLCLSIFPSLSSLV